MYQLDNSRSTRAFTYLAIVFSRSFKGFSREKTEREAGPPKHFDDEVDSDEQVVNKKIFLYRGTSLIRKPLP